MKILNHYKRWNELVSRYSSLISEGISHVKAFSETIATYVSRGHGKNKPFIKQWSQEKNQSRSKYNQENTKGKR